MAILSRSAKLIGDFGEGLAMYAFIRSQYEVVHVDHVGADLMAEKNGSKLAISVKTRNREKLTKESDMVVIKDDDINKLDFFSKKFGMDSVFCQIICEKKKNIIHMFIISVTDLKKGMKKNNNGYSLYYSAKKISKTKSIAGMHYSQWSDEKINVI